MMNTNEHGAPNNESPDKGQIPQIGPVLDVKRLLWVRVPLMLLIAVCVGVPAVTAAWFLVPVGYTASVQLRFLATAPFVLNRENTESTYDKFLSTQISLITGGAVLTRVLDAKVIRESPTIASASDPLEYLKTRVSARVDRGSEIVTITCSMPDKDAARQVLEELVTVYMNYATSEETGTGNARLATLTKERDARQMELDTQMKRIGDLQATLGLPMVGETPLETGEGQLYNESLARAEEDLAKAKNLQAEAQAQVGQIEGFLKKASKDDPIYAFGVEDRVGTDARVSGLRQEVVRTQAALSGMADIQQEDSPQVKAEQRRLGSLRASVADLELTVRKEVLEGLRIQKKQELDTLTTSVAEAQQRVTKFKELADGYKGRLKSTTDGFAQLEDLKSKAAQTRATLEAVRTSIATINVESNAPARIRLAAPVTVPGGGPDYKPRFMLMLMALVASGGLGFGVGLLLELTDQQVRSAQDLSRLTKLPIIATVPHASEDTLPASALAHLATEQAPLSVMADEYRRVLARLLYPSMPQGEMKSLVVVSPTRGDGKSSLTTNLGVALARAGRRVLLIDASYRRPTLEKRLDLPESTGLSEILNESASVESTIRPAVTTGLFVLGPGLDSGALAGMLASRQMAAFLQDMTQRFDQVIIDTPPWLVMADAKLLTPLVDGVVLVVGVGASSLGMVKRCLRELNEVKANVIGIVLNGVRRTPGGYMSKNKNLYYGYVHESVSVQGTAGPIPVGVVEGLSGEPGAAIGK